MHVRGLDASTNNNIEEVKKGPFTIIERKQCKSVNLRNAMQMYFFNAMGGRQRQVVANASNGIALQNGAMQAIIGDVEATTGLKGVGDAIGKMFRGSVTNEATVNPEYIGKGYVITEPTYKFLVPFDIKDFGGRAVLEDGYFYCAECCLNRKVATRKSFPGAVAGNEGLFNMMLEGNEGVFIVESDTAPSDLAYIYLENDVLKIDGSMAVLWSGSLHMTVERSSKSLIGSTMTGDGLLNVFRGTGLVVYKALVKEG